MMSDVKKTGLELLREPFPENQISKLPKPYSKDSVKGNCKECGGYHGLPAVHLDYVGHAALTDRLLNCDPAWDWQPLALDASGYPVIDKDGGMWIKLTVCGVTRMGYGDAQGKTGGNATKERIGDALRNAAMRFGAALDLWHKGDLHVDEPAPAKQPIKPSPAPNLQPPQELVNSHLIVIKNAKSLEELHSAYESAIAKLGAIPVIHNAKNARGKQLKALDNKQDAFMAKLEAETTDPN